MSDPKSVLDIGIGNGKYGFLCREYLPDIKLEGIEIHRPYVGPIQYLIYDSIHIGDAREILPGLDNYDLILMVDMLEHLEREDGKEVLDCAALRSGNIILSTPKHIGSQGHSHGNPYEAHRSQWRKSDFKPYQHFFVPNFNSIICYMGNNKKVRKKVWTSRIGRWLREV